MSRKATELGSLPSARNQGRDSMRMTGQSWADRRATGGGEPLLPDIAAGGLSGRRRPIGDAASMSGAGQGRAAGFKRDRANDAGATPSLGGSSGMPPGHNPSPTKSDRRLFGSTKDSNSSRYGGAPIN